VAAAGTTPTLDLAAALEQTVGRVWWALRLESGSDLSRTAAGALAALATHGPQRVTELAEHEMVTQPTMTCILDRLERDGRVERRPDPADGRARRVEITDAGRALLQERAHRRAEALGTRLDRLSATDRAALDAAVPALRALLEDAA
jgi:DNA-binding MarR family transcriptional regulator